MFHNPETNPRNAQLIFITHDSNLLEDEIIISQIENLIQPKVDIWDELNAAERELVMKGIKDLEEGRRIPLEDALNKFRKAR